MQTKFNIITVCVFTIFTSLNVNSALLERLDGLAYYDDESNLTWLADANYSQTSGYDSDGKMNWADAMTWATNLNIQGITGWRLPNTTQPDTTCVFQSGSTSSGSGCKGSEMGNLFYNTLDNTSIPSSKYGPFINVKFSDYWSATELDSNLNLTWYFTMFTGNQSFTSKTIPFNRAWAVRSGDVKAVPIPTSIWLFVSGIVGFLSMAKKQTLKGRT